MRARARGGNQDLKERKTMKRKAPRGGNDTLKGGNVLRRELETRGKESSRRESGPRRQGHLEKGIKTSKVKPSGRMNHDLEGKGSSREESGPPSQMQYERLEEGSQLQRGLDILSISRNGINSLEDKSAI